MIQGSLLRGIPVVSLLWFRSVSNHPPKSVRTRQSTLSPNFKLPTRMRRATTPTSTATTHWRWTRVIFRTRFVLTDASTQSRVERWRTSTASAKRQQLEQTLSRTLVQLFPHPPLLEQVQWLRQLLKLPWKISDRTLMKHKQRSPNTKLSSTLCCKTALRRWAHLMLKHSIRSQPIWKVWDLWWQALDP